MSLYVTQQTKLTYSCCSDVLPSVLETWYLEATVDSKLKFDNHIKDSHINDNVTENNHRPV